MNLTAAIKSIFTCAALAAVTFLAITTGMAVHTNSLHSAKLLTDADDAVQNVNAITKKINAPGGLLTVTGKAVAKADNVLGHTDILIANEQASLDNWNRQISTTLSNVNTAVLATTKNENKIAEQTEETLEATIDSVKAVKPLVDNLTIEAKDLQTTTQAVNAMVPDIQATAKNVNGMTADGKETTAMAKDWLHGILHPTWPERIKNAMLDVLQHLPVP